MLGSGAPTLATVVQQLRGRVYLLDVRWKDIPGHLLATSLREGLVKKMLLGYGNLP